jgi:pSer/pThr/pTyr-binding forkhead associated (FHA) protein
MAYLALSVEDVIINKWELTEGILVIGRSSECDIQINDPAVSSNHARLITEADPFVYGQFITQLEDMHSTNGTELNGAKVRRAQLAPNDIVSIGYNKFQLIDKKSNRLDETAIIIS